MKKDKDKIILAFDNKLNNWVMINKTNKYKFYSIIPDFKKTKKDKKKYDFII